MNMIDLPKLKENLSPHAREIFDRIYEEYYVTGNVHIPEAMVEWATKQFGSIDILETQNLLRLRNKLTGHEVVFNSVRASRPQIKGDPISQEELDDLVNKPPFNDMRNLTPEAPFGRIEGERSISAANVSMYDGWHGVLISKDGDPLDLSFEQVADYISVANQWFKKVHEFDSEAVYPTFQWNCLWRAGASIPWGHTQVTLSKHAPLSAVRLRQEVDARYREEYGGGYFDDLFVLHKELGLGFDMHGLRVMLPIDPKKEREFVILADEFDENVARALSSVLTNYNTMYGVESFNIVGYLPPFGKDDYGLPVIVRGVERGNLAGKNSELGIMEILAEVDVVTVDPFASVKAIVQLSR